MRTRYRKILVAAALTALALMAIFASAANAATPAPPYQDFAGCPSEAENEFVGECLKYEFTGGHMGIGNRTIPVTSPIVLRGAIEQETANFLFNSEGGLIPARQTVPGGLIGLTGYKWLDEAVGSSSALKLYATVELAGEPKEVIQSTIQLPVKVHLENQFLGTACYVGSTASPIMLNLTTGTTNPPAPNTPITGHPVSELEPEASRPKVHTGTGGVFVDNAYAVPAAGGCVLSVGSFHQSIDKLVNAAYALPSAAGKNTTVLDYNESTVLPRFLYPES